MSETTTPAPAPAPTSRPAEKAPPVKRGPFASESDARANKPPKTGYVLVKVTDPAGKVCWCWEFSIAGIAGAVGTAAMAAGWTGTKADSAAPTKDKVAAQLAALSEEDREALLAAYAPAKKGKK